MIELLTGNKYGKLTLIEYVKGSKVFGKIVPPKWKCICDCGNECIVRSDRVISGYTKSCGCFRKEVPTYKDITGEVFGKLTAISFKRELNKTIWHCKCECGNFIEVSLGSLKYKIDCGCGFVERSTQFKFKHGLTNTAEYYSYNCMKARCLDVNNHKYKNYGARGIKVCDRWLESFENFYSDMGIKPTPNHSLDRIDVNGNYEPSNCRWATPKQQSNNKTNNRYLEYNGKKMTHAEWARELGIKPYHIYQRIKCGFPIERVLSNKDGRYKKEHILN